MTEELDPKMVERLAQAVADRFFGGSSGLDDSEHCIAVAYVETVLDALPLSPAALNALYQRKAVVVPKEPTRQMVDALLTALGYRPIGDNLWAYTECQRAAGNLTLSDRDWSVQLAASPYAEKPNDQ